MAEPLDSMPGKLDALAVRVGKIEADMEENTRVTRENLDLLRDIRDLVTTGKVVNRIVRWAGGLAAAGAAIWGALHMGGGK